MRFVLLLCLWASVTFAFPTESAQEGEGACRDVTARERGLVPRGQGRGRGRRSEGGGALAPIEDLGLFSLFMMGEHPVMLYTDDKNRLALAIPGTGFQRQFHQYPRNHEITALMAEPTGKYFCVAFSGGKAYRYTRHDETNVAALDERGGTDEEDEILVGSRSIHPIGFRPEEMFDSETQAIASFTTAAEGRVIGLAGETGLLLQPRGRTVGDWQHLEIEPPESSEYGAREATVERVFYVPFPGVKTARVAVVESYQRGSVWEGKKFSVIDSTSGEQQGEIKEGHTEVNALRMLLAGPYRLPGDSYDKGVTVYQLLPSGAPYLLGSFRGHYKMKATLSPYTPHVVTADKNVLTLWHVDHRVYQSLPDLRELSGLEQFLEALGRAMGRRSAARDGRPLGRVITELKFGQSIEQVKYAPDGRSIWITFEGELHHERGLYEGSRDWKSGSLLILEPSRLAPAVLLEPPGRFSSLKPEALTPDSRWMFLKSFMGGHRFVPYPTLDESPTFSVRTLSAP